MFLSLSFFNSYEVTGPNRSDLLELMSEVRDDGSSVERHIAS